MHVDFDYFYAQCEELRKPSLRQAPLVVCIYSGRTEDSGVVSTANYAARAFGVKSGIPIKTAKARLAPAPNATFLPADMHYYSEISEKAMGLIQQFSDKFEQVSVDECFLEVSKSAESFEPAAEMAAQLKDAIRKALGLSCSVGVAPNKMLAKLASDFEKPDGLTVIRPESVQAFMEKLPVEKIPGIGPKTAKRLQGLGATTVSELSQIDRFALAEEFGRRLGAFIYNAARGIDDEPVADTAEKKQIVRIVTLKSDASTAAEMSDALADLCRDIMQAVLERKISFRNVGVLLFLHDLDQKSKSKTLKTHTDSTLVLESAARSLLEEISEDRGLRVRRLGLRVSDFQDASGQNTMSQFFS